MLVLALNCGSSSVKATLVRVEGEQRLMALQASNIGADDAALEVDGQQQSLDATTHAAAIHTILEIVEARSHGALDGVVHRVVHGGAKFTHPIEVNADTEQELDALDELAPLHNPVAVSGIRAARKLLPSIPHFAVFDTSFHSTLPAHAREYALPVELAHRLGIRRYGFHGTNHAHVARAVASSLQRPVTDLRIVSCHLGNGASVAAIERGRSVDTSMGMTPLEGLIMGSRTGDIDAGVLLLLLRKGFDVDALDDLLNRRSGLKGLVGTNDMRTIETQAAAGDAVSQHALAAYAYRIRKYIGAYAAAMGGVDVIAFTAGVGEHSATVRSLCVEHLEYLGVHCCSAANRDARVSIDRPVVTITAPHSRVHVVVVRADEEMAMVREVAPLLVHRESRMRSAGFPPSRE